MFTAHPLDKGQMAALTARLKSMVGSEVAVDATVDPNILGGLIVRSAAVRSTAPSAPN